MYSYGITPLMIILQLGSTELRILLVLDHFELITAGFSISPPNAIPERCELPVIVVEE